MGGPNGTGKKDGIENKVWQDEERWCLEKVFYTSDDPFKSLQNGVEKLYELFESTEYDAKF